MAVQSDKDNRIGQDDFSITVSRDSDGSVIVALAGEFDRSAAADLRRCLAGSDVLDARRVRVDCGAVTIGASGLGLLVGECKRVRATRAAMSASYGDGAARVLQVSGLIGLPLEGLSFSATELAVVPQWRADGS